MAYVQQQTPEEQQNKFANTNPTTPQPVPYQTGGSSGTGLDGGKSALGAGTSTQFGSNAAKLSDYLAANKEQAANFGKNVAGNLTNTYQNVVGGIDQGVSNFNQAVNQGWKPLDPDALNQAASNPVEYAKDPNNVAKFQGWYNNQYTGPQNFESSNYYGDINNNVQNSIEKANLTKTNAGLGTYLNNYMGANDTTEGMLALDTALLSRSPEARQAIKDATNNFGNLGSYLSNQVSSANQNAANAKQQANEARQSARDKFTGPTGAIPNFEKTLNDALAAKKAEAQSKIELAKAGVNDWPTVMQQGKKADVLKALAMPDNGDFDTLQNVMNWEKAWGYNPTLSNYLNTNSPDTLNVANVAKPEDYQMAEALSKLTGEDLSNFINRDMMQSRVPLNMVDFNSVGAANQLIPLRDELMKQFHTGLLGPNQTPFMQSTPEQKAAFWSLYDPSIEEILKNISAGNDTQLYPGGTPTRGPGGPV